MNFFFEAEVASSINSHHYYSRKYVNYSYKQLHKQGMLDRSATRIEHFHLAKIISINLSNIEVVTIICS